MNFGDSSHKTVEMPDCFELFGPKRAPLSRNRVKPNLKDEGLKLKNIYNSLCWLMLWPEKRKKMPIRNAHGDYALQDYDTRGRLLNALYTIL